jgi:hypothetical protein
MPVGLRFAGGAADAIERVLRERPVCTAARCCKPGAAAKLCTEHVFVAHTTATTAAAAFISARAFSVCQRRVQVLQISYNKGLSGAQQGSETRVAAKHNIRTECVSQPPGGLMWPLVEVAHA